MNSPKKSIPKLKKRHAPNALQYPKPALLFDRGMEYVKAQQALKEPVLFSGLLLHLDLSDEGLRKYGQRKAFQKVVQTLKLHVQVGYEKNLFSGKPVGSIFALKSFGWQGDESTSSSTQVSMKWGKKR